MDTKRLIEHILSYTVRSGYMKIPLCMYYSCCTKHGVLLHMLEVRKQGDKISSKARQNRFVSQQPFTQSVCKREVIIVTNKCYINSTNLR